MEQEVQDKFVRKHRRIMGFARRYHSIVVMLLKKGALVPVDTAYLCQVRKSR
jgi:hypothetical protein